VPKFVADSVETTGLKWVAPAGGGKVLQVVSATYSTQTNIASATFTDSGLSATITPSAATSKILVLVSQAFRTARAISAAGGAVRLLRGATSIFDTGGSTFDSSLNIALVGSGLTITDFATFSTFSITYLDSPNTTSATTYKTQGRATTTSNGGDVVFNRSGADSSMILMEIGA
jgi:hypothetical protein